MLGPGSVHRLVAVLDVADDAHGVYHESRASCDAQKTEHAVLATDFLLGIRQQRKREAQFLSKAAVDSRLVDTDAQDLSALPFEFGKTILVCLEFLRSAWRTGVYIESQDDTILAAEVTQPNQPSHVVRQFKIRRRVSDVQCHPGFP